MGSHNENDTRFAGHTDAYDREVLRQLSGRGRVEPRRVTDADAYRGTRYRIDAGDALLRYMVVGRSQWVDAFLAAAGLGALIWPTVDRSVNPTQRQVRVVKNEEGARQLEVIPENLRLEDPGTILSVFGRMTNGNPDDRLRITGKDLVLTEQFGALVSDYESQGGKEELLARVNEYINTRKAMDLSDAQMTLLAGDMVKRDRLAHCVDAGLSIVGCAEIYGWTQQELTVLQQILDETLRNR